MARRRRRRRSSNSGTAIVVIVAVAAVWLIGVFVARHLAAVLTFTAILAGSVWAVWYLRRRKGRAAEKRAQLEAEKAWEANRRAWRALNFTAGLYSVVVTGLHGYEADATVTELLCDIPGLRDQPVGEVEALVQRIIHIGPQPVAEGIAQDNAIHLKEALERRGAKVKIKEGVTRNGSSGREAIPAAVRREVWKRDEGRCVDCGSRERLEYDHIIAVANGGSNTARNIELRCESCNRKKGAKV
jgi:hypothetical protein